MAAQSGLVTLLLFVSFLPKLCEFSCSLLSHVSWFAPPPTFQAVFLIGPWCFLDVFSLSPSPISHTLAILPGVSTEHAAASHQFEGVWLGLGHVVSARAFEDVGT